MPSVALSGYHGAYMCFGTASTPCYMPWPGLQCWAMRPCRVTRSAVSTFTEAEVTWVLQASHSAGCLRRAGAGTGGVRLQRVGKGAWDMLCWGPYQGIGSTDISTAPLFRPGHMHAHRLCCAGRGWHPWAPCYKGQARAFGPCSAAAHVSERAAWAVAQLPSCMASCHGPDAATKYRGLLSSALLYLDCNKRASVRKYLWRSGWSYSVLKSRAAHRLSFIYYVQVRVC